MSDDWGVVIDAWRTAFDDWGITIDEWGIAFDDWGILDSLAAVR